MGAYMQFVDFLRQIVTLDFGRSFVTGDDLGTQLKAGALVSLSVRVPPFLFGGIVNVSLARDRVLFRHVLPNAWIPLITQNVTTIPFLILGSFLMERFFSIPGIGILTIDALSRGDLPILKAVTILGALALLAFNLFNDLLYAVADPRVRLS